jgi:hypothetical protein
MSFHTRLKDDSSRAISALLFYVMDRCRKGDGNVATELGLDISSMRQLENLKPDQINHLSISYFRETCPLEIFKLDLKKLSNMIQAAAEDMQTFEMSDEYLRRGASKNIMKDLFGMRSTQVANRKKFLNIKSSLGRSSSASPLEQDAIYDSWLASIRTTDYRRRLLDVSIETDIPLSKVYSVVAEIEDVNNSKQNQRQCA